MPEDLLLDLNQLRPRVWLWRDHPGYANGQVGPRQLRDHEFVLILDGKGTYEIRLPEGTLTAPLFPGQLILVRPKLWHTFKWGPYGTRHAFIHFDFDEQMHEANGTIRIAGISPFPHVMPIGLGSPASKLLRSVALQNLKDKPFFRLRWRCAFLEFLILLANGPLQLGNSAGFHRSQEQAVNEERIMKVKLYLNKHYHNPDLTTAMLAEAAFLSEPHFRRLCRQVTGLSPNDLIQQRRLNEARKLLLDASLQISEVARRSGFNDPRYFARIFRSIERITPKEYRESILAGQRY